jgi:uncharacterized protein (DUF2235 family)
MGVSIPITKREAQMIPINGKKKRLAIFLDGTWNKPDDNTNVWRAKIMLAEQDASGVPQLSYYDQGVGTELFNKYRGGIRGRGLNKNIREAYRWLMEHYDDGDEVFIFGFSRGAFTARSLAGMIAKCGLLQPNAPISISQIFRRYKDKDAKPLYELEYDDRHPVEGQTFTIEERWMLSYSVRIDIKFIGVWDTVGALGLPIGLFKKFRRRKYKFHNTYLSKIHKHAYQALAIDENRVNYKAALWTNYISEEKPDDTTPQTPNVEQRWFLGAHSNVGGGYHNDFLAQIPLAWLQDKAMECGLAFRKTITLNGNEHRGRVIDSYARFLKGLYRILKLGIRYDRPIGRKRIKVDKGWSDTVNESIDATVIERWQNDPAYRPKGLREWAERNKVDLDTISDTLKITNESSTWDQMAGNGS